MSEAAKYLEGEYPAAGPAVYICISTDSQSALRRLSDGPTQQTKRLPDEVWTRLTRIGRHHRVDLQWVPGHAGISGNEAADEVAGLAADLPQDRVQVSFGAARARLNHHLGREWTASNRHSRHFEVVGEARIKMGDRIGLSRRESVELARLRTGHSTLLRAYRHRIGLDDDPNCTNCDNGEPKDLDHLCTAVVSGVGAGETPCLRPGRPNTEGLRRCGPGAVVPEAAGRIRFPYGRQVRWPEKKKKLVSFLHAACWRRV